MLKDQILALHAEGKSYEEIRLILGCSKSTISYHCGAGQKEKTLTRNRSLRKDNSLLSKVDSFLSPTTLRRSRRKCDEDVISSPKKQTYDKLREFKNRDSKSFGYKEVREKIGDEPKCYLSGRKIDLSSPRTFSFDHIVPASKGGSNTLDNLGLATREANLAKSDLSVEEFIQLCVDVVVHNGFSVSKPKN